MLFTSYEFLGFFLPIVVVGFFVAGRLGHGFAALWLAAASLFFYGYWDASLLWPLVLSIGFNYTTARLIARASPARSKRLLAFGVAVDLAALACFKYTDFAILTFNQLTGAQLAVAGIVLPLGISFFTFTQIAFLVDVHRGVAREYNFVHYVLFVTYFPHLIAGPVLHHKQMMPQFSNPAIYHPRAECFAAATLFFAIGIAKKLVVADPLGAYATPVFAAAEAGAGLSLMAAWAGALSYTLQIYFDFSGYSDMAIGLSHLFGVQLPLNFNAPYKSPNIIEFWRRWHMTLSQFLRDYLYIPLGGNRDGSFRRYVNLVATMLLGGLWHGASWTFVVWGGLHGAFLVVNHAWRALRQRIGQRVDEPSRLGTACGVAVTFTATVIAWVFFRADSWAGALHLLGAMFGSSVPSSPMIGLGKSNVAYIVGGLAIVWALPTSQRLVGVYLERASQALNEPPRARSLELAEWALFTSILLFAAAASQLGASYSSPFLYFQF